MAHTPPDVPTPIPDPPAPPGRPLVERLQALEAKGRVYAKLRLKLECYDYDQQRYVYVPEGMWHLRLPSSMSWFVLDMYGVLAAVLARLQRQANAVARDTGIPERQQS